VLQVGVAPIRDEGVSDRPRVQPPGWQKRGGTAPIRIKAIGKGGGDATVIGTACYDGLRRWRRRVRWNARRIEIGDDVALVPGQAEYLLFRWHLGTELSPGVKAGATCCVIKWPDAVMAIRASAPILVSIERMPDNTMVSAPAAAGMPDHEHACVVVRSRNPLNAWQVSTIIRSRPASKQAVANKRK